MINKVYFEDNTTVAKTFPDSYFTLAYLDPNYGIGESKKNHKSRNTPVKQKNNKLLKAKDNIFIQEDWDEKPPSNEYFKEIFRISKNQIIFGANYFEYIVKETFKPPRRNDFNDFLKKHPKGWIIWDKLNGLNDFNDCELIYTSFDFDSYVLPYMWHGMMQGISIIHGSVQRGNKKLNEKRIHPTQKPMPLNYYLLNEFTKGEQNVKVFDGGVGSGGSRIACFEFGFDFIGCENSKHMFDLQEKNFIEKTRNIFNPTP